MEKGLETTGIPSMEELEKTPGFPSSKRLMEGPVAVIECLQEIPCDPCETACPLGAIEVGKPITNLPELDEDKCTGCGICIPLCPGLAIFVIDYTYSEDEALVTFPYEFLPLPEEDSLVNATDRSGRPLTKGRIVKVLARKQFDRTVVVSIAVLKKYAQRVRGIVLNRGKGE
ncbi:MAG: 4Fe-4S binding protein [Candidatus Bathyarchaeota archaeon]|nr:MAG: 4Fe-4S binding protein [Candidatus Bathyarchaeota archaeon]